MCIELGAFEPNLNKISTEIVIIDKDFKITLANTEFCKNHNITQEKAIGSYCYKIIPKVDKQCCFGKDNCPLTHAVKTKKGSRCLHNCSIDGKNILIDQFTIPLKDKNGETQSICIIAKKAREYTTGDINNIDKNINFKQKLSELIRDIQNYAELIIFLLKQHQDEEELEILLREVLTMTKYGNALLSHTK